MSNAYQRGEWAGRIDGTRAGEVRGYDDGYEYGYNIGYDSGYSYGYQDGKDQNGYDKGYASGFKIGKDTGRAKGADSGRKEGKKRAFEEFLKLVKPPIDGFDIPVVGEVGENIEISGGISADTPMAGSAGNLLSINKGLSAYSLSSNFNFPINLYSHDDYNRGYQDGYYVGLRSCYGDYEYNRGYNDGYNNYYKIAYAREYSDGRDYGKQIGYSEGYKVGLSDGSQNGNGEYQNGYNKGYQEGYDSGYYEKYQSSLDEKYNQMSSFYSNNSSLFVEKSKLVDSSGNGYLEKNESFEIKLVVTNIGLKSTFIESSAEDKPDYNVYVTLFSQDKRVKLDSTVFVLSKLDGSSREFVGNLWGTLIDDTVTDTNGRDVSFKITLEYNGEVQDTEVIKVSIMDEKELPVDVVPFEKSLFARVVTSINFRSSPTNLGSENVIDVFEKDRKLTLLGSSKDDKWVYVRDDKERLGWVTGSRIEGTNQYKYLEIIP